VAPTFYYHWLRDGSAVAGATTSSYTAQGADEGHVLSCEVIAINEAGDTRGVGTVFSAGVLIASGLSPGLLLSASIVSSPSTALRPVLWSQRLL
jgi:large repetitive protein